MGHKPSDDGRGNGACTKARQMQRGVLTSGTSWAAASRWLEHALSQQSCARTCLSRTSKANVSAGMATMV